VATLKVKWPGGCRGVTPGDIMTYAPTEPASWPRKGSALEIPSKANTSSAIQTLTATPPPEMALLAVIILLLFPEKNSKTWGTPPHCEGV
jgi:hypothetical protein